jgi:cation diffusion facilitator CzcD-associated flavoprotein CzcO
MSHLPGCKFPPGTPIFVARAAFVRYLQDYARRFQVPLRTGVEVLRISREKDQWLLETSAGEVRAAGLIMATGIVSNPTLTALAGRSAFLGLVLHSCEYHRPTDIPGTRILVVGAGNSGAEIAAELARIGRDVDVAVRSGANVVPRELFGIPIQYLSYYLRKLPRPVQELVTKAVQAVVERRRGPSPLPRSGIGPLDAIPIIGFELVDAIRARKIQVRPGVAEFTREGVRFNDGSVSPYDAIVLATGYRPALQPLGDQVRHDSKGFALRRDRVTSSDRPNLWFVGHNYDATGGLANIARDAPLAAQAAATSFKKR